MGTISLRELSRKFKVSPHVIAAYVYGDPEIVTYRSPLNRKAICVDANGLARIEPKLERYKAIQASLQSSVA